MRKISDISQEVRFVPLKKEKVDLKQHSPVNTLFGVVHCSQDMFRPTYDEFICKRRKLLTEHAKV